MDDKQIEMVALFRCKSCGTRLFWKDCRGHMTRHETQTNGDLREYFVRGKQDTPEKPGRAHVSMYQRQKQRRQKNRQA